MQADMILRSDLLDLLFETRNKEYGAYKLRRQYTKHLLVSFTGPVLVLFLFWFLVGERGPDVDRQPTIFSGDTTTHVIQPPPLIEPPLPPPAPVSKQQHASRDFFTPVITDESVEPIAEAPELLQDDVILGRTGEGPIGPPAPEPAPPAAEIKPVVPEPEVLTVAEVMPEFPGGIQAFNRFMAKHLRVPEDMNEPGARVRMLVHFIVNKDGSLQDIRFGDSAQMAGQREIRRVFQKMPRWNPGSQHGRAVNVHYTLPIVFEIPEQ